MQPGNGYIEVTAGWTHNLALKGDGMNWAWGDNIVGMLGNGIGDGINDNSQKTPSRGPVLPGVGVVVASTEGQHSAALAGDGTVWMWGSNLSGQFGDGTTTMRILPVKVPGLSGVVDIALNGGFSVVLFGRGVTAYMGN